jgi:hypothetical protein
MKKPRLHRWSAEALDRKINDIPDYEVRGGRIINWERLDCYSTSHLSNLYFNFRDKYEKVKYQDPSKANWFKRERMMKIATELELRKKKEGKKDA